ncbi:hypothetical protein [Caulobacter sp. BP25]|uniref:hypothetical protein n=1 Tax=Caulobacter sp. BP25 TaxID=2048900 RepID=UPI000C12AC77|nr:hypothetical protein [Caulobacter sp. BP25]PHY20899.1 hypothetical protein CSW59_06725 [Caulobacter sp. BP25]
MKITTEAGAVVGAPLVRPEPWIIQTLEDPGLRLIARERDHQLDPLRYRPEDDDKYEEGQLWNAAHGYLSTIGSYDMGETPAVIAKDPPEYWPWAAKHWKPKGSIEDLTRAGALIAAEITRRIRAKKRFVQLLIDAAVAGGADRPYAEAQAEIELDEYLKSEGIEVGCKGHDWGQEGAQALAEDLILRHLEQGEAQ